MAFTIHHGDCREVLATLHAASVDSIVSDPPYGLSFMGKVWDHGVPGVEFWTEALRVAKPGAHLLAFGGTRTYHRLACAIEDAGWEIRDCVMWVYGSGFPKSHDVSKAIDKAAGAEREVVGGKVTGRALGGSNWRDGDAGGQEMVPVTAPATDAARQWSGWGTALKPAWEPIIVARKPLVGTVAENVLTHGTGAINVDGCRVRMSDEDAEFILKTARPNTAGKHHCGNVMNRPVSPTVNVSPAGRWPANLIHDGSEEVVGLFPDTGKSTGGRTVKRSGGGNVGSGKSSEAEWSNEDPGYGDSGSAARFFYCAKASKADRGGDNKHPTVKPTDLMRYLCRLVTPPGGVVLDPFTGSGSTGKAAILEGFRFIGIEREAEYVEIAKARIAAAMPKRGQLF
jgi:site-specific DNA-methyltransferase (adenine-specific)